LKGNLSITSGEIAAVTGGRILCGGRGIAVTDVTTDSREPAGLYIPIVGEKFDGHDFIEELCRSGSVKCCMTMKTGYEKIAESTGTGLILCDDTLKALGALGKHHRDRFRPLMVGVTGTNGKTTTKELIHIVLSSAYTAHKNVKNYNNEIGVPFTLMQIDENFSAAVIEMGMNHTGEIERLAMMVQPDIGVITSIGAGHLEFLGSVENVAFAKCEIMNGMKPGSTLIANRDTECFHIIARLAAEHGLGLVTYGLNPEAQIKPDGYTLTEESTTVVYKKVKVTVPLYGKHNIHNILAALAVAETAGIDLGKAASALSSFENIGGRSEIIHSGYTVINDTYNSNPLSSLYALESVCDVFPGRKRFAVLADMKELGESSPLYHMKVGEFVADRKFDGLFLFGEMSQYYADGAQRVGMKPERIKIFGSKDELSGHLKSFLADGDVLLVKGSRSMKMEDVVNSIVK